MELKVKRA